jgi:shikimate kinase
MNNIILIGFMGCGKTTVGQQLARKLNFSFLDTDRYIEQKNGRTVSSIFEDEGEEYFRDLETQTIKELIGKLSQTIVSVGGGLPIKAGNSEILKSLGTVIYLEATKDTLAMRLKNDKVRPLLAGNDGLRKMELLYDKRLPFYEAACDIKIITEGKNLTEVVNCICERVKL